MTAEAKLRMLAKADTTLQEYFGGPSDLFRWFDTQLLPGYISRGTCARVLRVSTVFLQAHGTSSRRSLLEMEQPRFQIDVLDFDPERARSAASAIKNWLGEIDLSSDAQFASPPTSPTRHPYTLLNERKTIEPQLDRAAHVQMLDVRLFNLEE